MSIKFGRIKKISENEKKKKIRSNKTAKHMREE